MIKITLSLGLFIMFFHSICPMQNSMQSPEQSVKSLEKASCDLYGSQVKIYWSSVAISSWLKSVIDVRPGEDCPVSIVLYPEPKGTQLATSRLSMEQHFAWLVRQRDTLQLKARLSDEL